jgi:hypothetical protein
VKAALWLISAGLLVAETPPLPEWQATDQQALKKGDLVPGAMLLTEESLALPLGEEVEPPKEEEVAQAPVPPPVVPEEYLDAYFGERPTRFMVDPQGLLSDKDARDRENFLKYHSGDSAIDLFVYLFDGHQEIPSEVREEEIVERHFSGGKPAVVVYYYLGAPGKADIHVSPLISDSVSAADQRRALASSVEEALEKPDKVAQFEAFSVQLAIRVYWMERAAGLVTEVETSPLVRPLVKTDKKAGKPSAPSWRMEGLAAEWGPSAGIMGAAIFVVAGGLAFARRQARYSFPVFEVPSRMGGAHAAGIGAVISFGSTTQSPSSQRNEVPDYLGL